MRVDLVPARTSSVQEADAGADSAESPRDNTEHPILDGTENLVSWMWQDVNMFSGAAYDHVWVVEVLF